MNPEDYIFLKTALPPCLLYPNSHDKLGHLHLSKSEKIDLEFNTPQVL